LEGNKIADDLVAALELKPAIWLKIGRPPLDLLETNGGDIRR